MSGTIPLHPTRGIDPHMSICPRCGGDGEELILGDLRKAEVNGTGQYVYANRGKTSEAGQDLEKQGVIINRHDLHWEAVEEHERVPASRPCNKCEADIEMQEGLVKAGGVYFRCTVCHCEGVIKDNEFTRDIRKNAGVEAPKPIGVEFDNCENHGGKPE